MSEQEKPAGGFTAIDALWAAHLARRVACRAGGEFNAVHMEGQPGNGSCIYLAKVLRPGSKERGPGVSICSLPLAAKKIDNGTHVVASFNQIAGYLEYLAAKFARIRRLRVTTSQPSQGEPTSNPK